MLFTSYTFAWFFFLGVLPLRWLVASRRVPVVLLASSYVFYFSWSIPYGLLLAALTAFTFALGRALGSASRRRWVLGGGLTALLLLLAVFKYANFLLPLLAIHRRIDVILPLGISFYTFEMISYLVDVGRGAAPARSFVHYALYVAYFPHLIAGPIVRAGELLPQFERPASFDGEVAAEGMFIALTGFVQKMVFADNLGVYADSVFRDASHQSTLSAWLGVLAYTGQIFCDFSGYTNIGRGCSKMLGIELPENFDYPYLSRSITEFWRRWHMTLSRWLRDYLYIGLGGSRNGRVATYRNLFLTMLLGGLWHGASWTFVAWGGYHGALLALHKTWDSESSRSRILVAVRETRIYGAVAWAATFFAVLVGWVLFRSTTFASAGALLHRMFWVPAHQAWSIPDDAAFAVRLLVLLAVIHMLGVKRLGLVSHRGLTPPVRGLIWAGMIGACYLLATGSPAFIYFMF